MVGKKKAVKKTVKKKTAKRTPTKLTEGVHVHRHNEKTEVIVIHGGDLLRVLCDDDGIHVGEIVKRD